MAFRFYLYKPPSSGDCDLRQCEIPNPRHRIEYRKPRELETREENDNRTPKISQLIALINVRRVFTLLFSPRYHHTNRTELSKLGNAVHISRGGGSG